MEKEGEEEELGLREVDGERKGRQLSSSLSMMLCDAI